MLEGPSLDSFQEAHAVHRWWGSGERARRPGHTAWVPRGQSADWCRTRSRAICCRRAICPPAALNIINVSYNRTIASCDSVDVVLRCPKTLGPVGLVGASEVRFLLAPRASGFKCLMWRAAVVHFIQSTEIVGYTVYKKSKSDDPYVYSFYCIITNNLVIVHCCLPSLSFV